MNFCVAWIFIPYVPPTTSERQTCPHSKGPTFEHLFRLRLYCLKHLTSGPQETNVAPGWIFCVQRLTKDTKRETGFEDPISRMCSKGSRFTLGVWGLRVCSLDVAQTIRNRSQPFSTVRNRPRDGHMAVPMVSSAEGVVFGGFICAVASFRVAGVALRDMQTCFVTCRKSFCVAGAVPLRRFQKRCVAVFVAGTALWTCPKSFCAAGAAL